MQTQKPENVTQKEKNPNMIVTRNYYVGIN